MVEVGRDEKVMRMVRGGESGWDMMQPRAAQESLAEGPD